MTMPDFPFRLGSAVSLREVPQAKIHFQGNKSTTSEDEVAGEKEKWSNVSPLSGREAPASHIQIFLFSYLWPHANVACILHISADDAESQGKSLTWQKMSFHLYPSFLEVMDCFPLVQ